jgi:Tfp pilus assembly protein FimT
MRSFIREDFRRRYGEKGSSLVVGVALMAIFLPLALPVLSGLYKEPVSADKPSKYSAALALAQTGIEKAIREMNNGDISSWDGDSTVRMLTLSRVQSPEGKETGDVEIRVKWPYEQYPVVEAVGRVTYTSSFRGRGTARFIVERKARTVLQRNEYEWAPVFSNAPASLLTAEQGVM